MKAFLNPFLLLVCILLLAFSYVSSASGEEGNAMVETWVLTLCLLGVIINGILGVARMLTQRPSVQLMGWAVGFLIAGCVVWTFVSGENTEGVSSQERRQLREQVEAWRAGQLSPWALDDNGEGILILAAGLGEAGILEELLSDTESCNANPQLLELAAQRAAERNREQSLLQLMDAGVSANTVIGFPLLQSAVMNKAHRAAACLLKRGAQANVMGLGGMRPLHHAALANDLDMVHLLLQHGADPSLPNADGREPASYARSESVIETLAAPAAQAP